MIAQIALMCTPPAAHLLRQAFWAVMERGGYETVTAGKQWKEICRCLPGVDLTGQTSASYNSERPGWVGAGRHEGMRLSKAPCLLPGCTIYSCNATGRTAAVFKLVSNQSICLLLPPRSSLTCSAAQL